MTKVIVGEGKSKRFHYSISPVGVSYPECPYYRKAEVIDGECNHPYAASRYYCSLMNKPGVNECPFDIKVEMKRK